MKSLLVFIFGGLFGFVAGAGAMLVAFPFVFPPPAVNETVAAMDAETLLAETRFRDDADGQDAAHWGKGGLKIYRAADGNVLLELQSDFEVGAGPNFWLYINTAADINNEDDFENDRARIRLTKLKSFTGSQVYAIDGADYGQAKAVTIWCESFNQYIASANV